MDLEGRIDVVLTGAAGRIGSVVVHSSRPQLAQRILAGRSAADAAALVGTLFSLCGKAQRAACRSACDAAIGGAGPTPESGISVLAEMAIEHAWRLLLDWPGQVEHRERPGVAPHPRVLAELRRESGRPEHLALALVRLLEDLLGEPPTDWLSRDAQGIARWCESDPAPASRLLAAERDLDPGDGPTLPLIPPVAGLSDQELVGIATAALLDPGFCARPRWRGGPAETGALARLWGHPILEGWINKRGLGAGARMLARLVELASIPAWLTGDGPPVIRPLGVGAGTGLAAVETARGLLIHVVRLVEDRISQYRIIAPTEWNCAGDGPLATGLACLGVGPDLEHRARRLICAIDPCVACGLEIRDA